MRGVDLEPLLGFERQGVERARGANTSSISPVDARAGDIGEAMVSNTRRRLRRIAEGGASAVVGFDGPESDEQRRDVDHGAPLAAWLATVAIAAPSRALVECNSRLSG